MKRVLVLLVAILTYAVFPLRSSTAQVYASEGFFDVQSVDTMKYSRDAARNPDVMDKIPLLVDRVAYVHPTHMAIGTPYDEEFYPVMKIWVEEARKHGINIWFRGNFSSWEGWFGYDKFNDPNEHHAKTYAFITAHPDLFREGDIFTPAPEPENGGFGDPRQGEEIKKKFMEFLPRSYGNCVDAFRTIGKNVTCGYFSTNGDVAKIIPAAVLEQSGGVQVIDHYVKTPAELIRDIKYLHDKNRLPIVLGEYGAPIPDIHGDLSEKDQEKLIRGNLKELVKYENIIKGINYWTVFGGSTEIFSGADFKPKLGADTLREYFSPIAVTGQVVDEWDNPIPGAIIGAVDLVATKSDKSGIFRFVTTQDFGRGIAIKDGYYNNSFLIPSRNKTNLYNLKVTLTKKDRTLIERMQIILYKLGLFFKKRES